MMSTISQSQHRQTTWPSSEHEVPLLGVRQACHGPGSVPMCGQFGELAKRGTALHPASITRSGIQLASKKVGSSGDARLK